MASPIDWQKFSRPVWRAATLVYHFPGGQWIGGAHHNFEKDYERLRAEYGEPIKVTQSPLVPEYPYVSNPGRTRAKWRGFRRGVYEIRLDAPENLERVVLDEGTAHLFRFGKYVVSFTPTPAQERKIRERDGEIRLVERQITRRAA